MPRERLITFDIVPTIAVTYKLDDITFAAIKNDLDSAVGMAVTLVNDKTAGFGSNNDKLLGIIDKAESDGYATIRTAHYAEGVKVGTVPPTAGAVIRVDGEGGIIAANSQTTYGPIVISIDTAADTGLDEETATIKF